MPTLAEMQNDFGVKMTAAETIRLKYDGLKTDMSAQEELEYTNLINAAFDVQGKIEMEQKRVAIADFAKTAVNVLPQPGGVAGNDGTAHDNAQSIKSWNKFLLNGNARLEAADLQHIAKSTSIKAYQADNPAGGGYLVAPEEFVNALIVLVENLVFIRKMAKTFTLIRADSLGFPALDVDPSDADWTVELGTGNEETTMAFGKRELRPSPLAKRVKISNKLLRNATVDVQSVIQERLAYKFGVTEEKAFLVGSGANQPLGVFTPSALGIPTSRDTVAASSGAIVGDDVMNVFYSVKAQYQANGVFIMARQILLAMRKLKDTTNNYIWATGFGPGLGYQGAPATILGRPYFQSEYAPSAITTGLYTLIYGDFSKYYIATALDMQLQVLDQLYAETNQMGYIARMEVDGMPVLSEAFARLVQP